jgi:hypothetical protein
LLFLSLLQILAIRNVTAAPNSALHHHKNHSILTILKLLAVLYITRTTSRSQHFLAVLPYYYQQFAMHVLSNPNPAFSRNTTKNDLFTALPKHPTE